MPVSSLTKDQRRVDERTTYLYTAVLKDEAGDTIADDDLATLTLLLYDKNTGDIINSRGTGTNTLQDVLNTNNVTVSSGTLTWKMQVADNALVGNPAGTEEEHVALFTFTWADSDADTRTGRVELTLIVRNLGKLP